MSTQLTLHGESLAHLVLRQGDKLVRPEQVFEETALGPELDQHHQRYQQALGIEDALFQQTGTGWYVVFPEACLGMARRYMIQEIGSRGGLRGPFQVTAVAVRDRGSTIPLITIPDPGAMEEVRSRYGNQAYQQLREAYQQHYGIQGSLVINVGKYIANMRPGLEQMYVRNNFPRDVTTYHNGVRIGPNQQARLNDKMNLFRIGPYLIFGLVKKESPAISRRR